MVVGLVVFTVGSVLGAVAPTQRRSHRARVIMGVGAAASEPGHAVDDPPALPGRGERAQALGVWAAVSGLALAAGPVIGGALVGVWSWRAVFVFNIVAGLVALVGVRDDPAGERQPATGAASMCPGSSWGRSL